MKKVGVIRETEKVKISEKTEIVRLAREVS